MRNCTLGRPGDNNVLSEATYLGTCVDYVSIAATNICIILVWMMDSQRYSTAYENICKMQGSNRFGFLTDCDDC